MPPLPKQRSSKGRRDRRRAHHALRRPHLVQCPECNHKRFPHHVCPNCGYYQGREIISKEES